MIFTLFIIAAKGGMVKAFMRKEAKIRKEKCTRNILNFHPCLLNLA